MKTHELSVQRVANPPKESAVAGIRIAVQSGAVSRARGTRWGTYYPKTYVVWKARAVRDIASLCDICFMGRIRVCITCVEIPAASHSPKKRAYLLEQGYPRGDVDNMAKSILDAATLAKI